MARKSPNQDTEVMQNIMKAFKMLADDDDEHKKLREQFVAFHLKKGMFASLEARDDATSMSPIDWWGYYGSEVPELCEIALKVLSQPISSSSAERNWSTYSYIHSVKRNRLNCDRADKLVFIHSNIRVQSRFTEAYTKGPHQKWDINPNHDSLVDKEEELEEMRWKSLIEDDKASGSNKRKPTSGESEQRNKKNTI